jgi:hypothetical protein
VLRVADQEFAPIEARICLEFNGSRTDGQQLGCDLVLGRFADEDAPRSIDDMHI